MASVSDFIELAPSEIVVKEYRSFRMKKPQNAVVNIAATNMRLILYGQSSRGRKSGRPTLTQEIRIEDIRGVEIYEKEKPNLVLIVVGLFFLASAALIKTNHLPSIYRLAESILGNGEYGTIIAGILGIISIVTAFIFRNKEFEILVKGRTSNLNTGMFSEKTVFKEGIDSPKILRELGSIIIQIQKDRKESFEKHNHETRSFREPKRMEFGVEDLVEEKNDEYLYEAEEKEEAEVKSKAVPEKQDTKETKEPDNSDIEKENVAEEEGFKQSPKDINVDDILETMQMIENPTSKKKDDFLF